MQKAAAHGVYEMADRRPLWADGIATLEIAIGYDNQTKYTAFMRSAVTPQIRVEPRLRAELESVLSQPKP